MKQELTSLAKLLKQNLEQVCEIADEVGRKYNRSFTTDNITTMAISLTIGISKDARARYVRTGKFGTAKVVE